MLDAGLPARLLDLLQRDEVARVRVAKVLMHLLKGTPTQVRRLVEMECIRTIAAALTGVKEYDRCVRNVFYFFTLIFFAVLFHLYAL